MDVFMRDSDAFTWYMERDPALRSTVVVVAWLEQRPDWDTLVARLDRVTRIVPSFRQRVLVPPARMATPRWTVDDRFDLTWHMRRVESPEPHTPATVLEIARTAAMAAFDPAHPLWEFTLVEHLAGERAALVMKLHHSLTDGIGGMQLALLLFDLDADAPEAMPEVTAPDPEYIGNGALMRGCLGHAWSRGVEAVDGLGGMVPTAWRAARHPFESIGSITEITRSIIRTVAPVLDTKSPVMRDRSLGRHLEMVEVGLGDLKRAAAVAGGTVNDGYLAAIAGGFRRYHERHGAPVDELRVTLPISIRTAQDPLGGNRITLMRFAVPVADADPASRIRAMGRLCRAAQAERSLPYTDAIAGTLNLLPPAVVGGMLKHVDFVASDVPGFTFPVYLAGARLSRYSAFGPTIGTSVNLTLISYEGVCTVGMTIDAAAVPDPGVLAECVREGFEEVLALAGAHGPVRLPLRDAVVEAVVEEVVQEVLEAVVEEVVEEVADRVAAEAVADVVTASSV